MQATMKRKPPSLSVSVPDTGAKPDNQNGNKTSVADNLFDFVPCFPLISPGLNANWLVSPGRQQARSSRLYNSVPTPKGGQGWIGFNTEDASDQWSTKDERNISSEHKKIHTQIREKRPTSLDAPGSLSGAKKIKSEMEIEPFKISVAQQNEAAIRELERELTQVVDSDDKKMLNSLSMQQGFSKLSSSVAQPVFNSPKEKASYMRRKRMMVLAQKRKDGKLGRGDSSASGSSVLGFQTPITEKVKPCKISVQDDLKTQKAIKNREAAFRWRQQSKEKMITLEKEREELKETMADLESENKSLKHQIEMLQSFLESHASVFKPKKNELAATRRSINAAPISSPR